MSLLDIIKSGKDKMKEMDIATHRKNVKEMRDCHGGFLHKAFEAMVDSIGSNDRVDLEEIQSPQSQNVSSFIVNFNELKKRHIQPSNFVNRFHHIASMK